MATNTGFGQVRENLRLQQVYNVLLRYSMDMLFDQGIVGSFRRRMQQWIYKPEQPIERLSNPVKVRLLLQELGPTYVKMGQIVSSRAEVLPPEWAVEFKKLQSDVPPFPYEEVEVIFQEEFKESPEDLFATFDPEPLAAASTAQVHRATLDDGQMVVVKVQRPNIQNQVKADMGILLNGTAVLERRAEWARDANLVGMLKEFGENVIYELDYTGEAYNARRISRNMAEIPNVHIPKIYPHYSTTRVLTMEFIDGVKVTNSEAISAAGLDRHALAEAAIRSLVKQLLIDGFFHADPHPGNVLVSLDTGMLNYIDLGMVGEIDLNQRFNLIQLLMVVQQHDADGLAQVMMSLSKPFKEVDERGYYRNFDRKVGRYLEPDSGAGFSSAVNAALDMLTAHGMRLDPELTLALKALMQLEAITSSLLPESSVVEMAERNIRELVVDEVTTERVTEAIKKEATKTGRELLQRMPTLQEATLKWLNMYEKGRFVVEVDTSDLTNEIRRTRPLARMAVVGILITGMIIGSAIAANVTAQYGEFDSFITRLTLIAYIVSIVVGIIALIILVWRLWRGGEE
jgi:ubiquinone biosynthesis protein